MKEEVLEYIFTINYPTCGHSEDNHTARSTRGMESLTKSLIEKQMGLCHKCYYNYCKKNEIVAWWSK